MAAKGTKKWGWVRLGRGLNFRKGKNFQAEQEKREHVDISCAVCVEGWREDRRVGLGKWKTARFTKSHPIVKKRDVFSKEDHLREKPRPKFNIRARSKGNFGTWYIWSLRYCKNIRPSNWGGLTKRRARVKRRRLTLDWSGSR